MQPVLILERGIDPPRKHLSLASLLAAVVASHHQVLDIVHITRFLVCESLLRTASGITMVPWNFQNRATAANR